MNRPFEPALPRPVGRRRVVGARRGRRADPRGRQRLVQMGEHEVAGVVLDALPFRVPLAVFLLFGLDFGLLVRLPRRGCEDAVW